MLCPNLKCGQTVVAADAARGKIVRCAHCKTLFMVPKDAKKTIEPKRGQETQGKPPRAKK